MVTKIILKTTTPITNFADERNKLLRKAKTKWILFVDSDEVVSDALQKEIEDMEKNTHYDGFYVMRNDYFLGKWLRFGETGRVRLLRLGKKGRGKWVRPVHEYWDIKNAGVLKNPLLHYPHKTISDFIKSINHYSDIHAKELGKLTCVDLIKPIGKFIVNYFLWLGFLDGMAGFIHAFMMSFQSLVTRVKQVEFAKT